MKTRKKRSIVWNSSKEEFQKIINSSHSMAEVCSHLGLRRDGGNYSTIKRRIYEENVDDTQLSNGQKSKHLWLYIDKENFLKKLFKWFKFSKWVG